MFVDKKESNRYKRLTKKITVAVCLLLSASLFVTVTYAQPNDENSRVYNGACNIEGTNQNTSSKTPPTINNIYPVILKAGYAVQISLKGVGLANAKVVTHNHHLIVNSTRSTDSQVVFDLMVNENASRGAHNLTLVTPLGEAVFEMILMPHPVEGLNSSSSTGSSSVYSPLTDSSVVASSEPSIVTDNSVDDKQLAIDNCNHPVLAAQSSLISGAEIRLLKGSGITRISPSSLPANMNTTDLTLHGVGLGDVDNLSIIPSDDVVIGDIQINEEGTTVTVPVTVTPGVSLGRRQVVLSVAGQPIPPLSNLSDRLYIGGKLPAIDSIEPVVVNPGEVTRLTVRGNNFQQAGSVFIAPAGDIIIASKPNVNNQGTELTIDIAVASSVALGSRVVAVSTPTGISSTILSPENTLAITETQETQETQEVPDTQLAPAIAIGSRTVEEGSASEKQKNEYHAPHIGVIKGAALYKLHPMIRPVGSSFMLTLHGVGLQNIDDIKFIPDQGMTVGSVTTSSEGDYLTANVTIAEDAPVTIRQVQLVQNGKIVPVVIPGNDRFRITAKQPFIESVTPNVILTNNSPQSLILRGQFLSDLQQLRIEPDDGIRIDKTQISQSGNMLSAKVTVSDSAATGTRTIVVDSKSGSSEMAPNPANAITLVNEIDNRFETIVSSLLKVTKAVVTSPVPIKREVQSSLLGIGIQKKNHINPPVIDKVSVITQPLGVAVGSIATDLTPAVVATDNSATLTVNGFQLDTVTDVELQPNTGIIVGSVLVENRQISVPLTIAADAPHISRRIIVNTNDGAIKFSDLAAGILQISGSKTVDNVVN